MQPTFYEFFAGGGMARAGLGEGWRCLFANDIDPKKGRSYTQNWGDAEFRLGDIFALNAADLPGQADLAWASFPCQDLSLAGLGAGLAGERSGAFGGFDLLLHALRNQGRAPRLQSCPCQKQPCTKTAMRRPGQAMSGRPGMSLRCRR